ncbi:MAG: metal-dependent hydrolase [Leptospirales bacterium]
MNFPQHIKGAVLAGAAVGVLAIASGQVDVEADSLAEFVRNPLAEGPFRKLFGLCILAWFMGLFPDLDTGSTPRKFYFHGVIVILAALYIVSELRLLAFVAIASLAPMLHKHRGWTHWLITPWLLSALLALALEYLRARDSWFFGFDWWDALEWWLRNWIYTAAFVIGHYTHLLLDSKLAKLVGPKTD